MSKIWKYLACNTKTDDVEDYYFEDYRDLRAKRVLLHEFQDIMVNKFGGSFRSREHRAQTENQSSSENPEIQEIFEDQNTSENQEKHENKEYQENLEYQEISVIKEKLKSEEPIYANQSFILKHAEEHELPSFMFATTGPISRTPSFKFTADSEGDSEAIEQDEASVLVRKSPPLHVYDIPEGCDIQIPKPEVATLEINPESTTYVNKRPGIDEDIFRGDSENSNSNKEETQSTKEIKPSQSQLLTEIQKFLNKDSDDFDEITIWDVKEATRSVRNVNDAATIPEDASKGLEQKSGCFTKFGNIKNNVNPRGVDPRQFNRDIILELKAKFNDKD
ncbi:uncharacterized protein [Onthophagus taurus]|uniref:uncharacterized protein n=1 Tax=Onthophagus taurus TaxID=166361 RepID=UPI0039BE8A9B